MSETTNLAVQRESVPAPSAPSAADWRTMREQAQVVLQSGMAPKALNSAEKILTVALKGRELNVPMMQALSHIHVVEGKPTLSAEMMVALVQRAGHKIRVLETTSEYATVQGVRADDPEHKPKVTFDWEDAKKAGVTNKNTWKAYPDAMLRARAISALCRFAFADVLAGASYVPEEMGAEVNGDGEVVEMSSSGAPAPSEARSPGHTALLEKVETVWVAIPEAERPDYEGVMDYAEKGEVSAGRALERVTRIRDEAKTSEETEGPSWLNEPDDVNADVPQSAGDPKMDEAAEEVEVVEESAEEAGEPQW